jgi:hypothetical protein
MLIIRHPSEIRLELYLISRANKEINIGKSFGSCINSLQVISHASIVQRVKCNPSKNVQSANLYSYYGCITLDVCDMLLQKQRPHNGFMLLSGCGKLELWKIIVCLKEFTISFNELNIVNPIHCYFRLFLRVISVAPGGNRCTAERQVVWSCLLCMSYLFRLGFSTTDAEKIDN